MYVYDGLYPLIHHDESPDNPFPFLSYPSLGATSFRPSEILPPARFRRQTQSNLDASVFYVHRCVLAPESSYNHLLRPSQTDAALPGMYLSA